MSILTKKFLNCSNPHNNRKFLFDSIPSLIQKSKNIHENKITNQSSLFQNDEKDEEELTNKTNDWSFDVKLSKEFESLGFYISDHPLNQYSDLLESYKIINFDDN